MNICAITGELASNAIVRGKEKKVLLFTVATKNGTTDADKNPSISFVPCVLFNPDSQVEQLFIKKGKGLRVELQGRLNSSRVEKDNETQFRTEVVVYNKSLHFLN